MINRNSIPQDEIPILWLLHKNGVLPGMKLIYSAHEKWDITTIQNSVNEHDGYVLLGYIFDDKIQTFEQIIELSRRVNIYDENDKVKLFLAKVIDYGYYDFQVNAHIEGIMPIDYYDLKMPEENGEEISFAKAKEFAYYPPVKNIKKFKGIKKEIIQLENSLRQVSQDNLTDLNFLSNKDDEFSILVYLLKVASLPEAEEIFLLYDRDIETSINFLYELRLKQLAWIETREDIEEKIDQQRASINKIEIIKDLINEYQREVKNSSIFNKRGEQTDAGYDDFGKGKTGNPVIDLYIDKFEKIKLSNQASEAIRKELGKLSFMAPQNPEYTTVLEYLDAMSNLPWGKIKKGNEDIEKAKKVLDKSNYGLEDVKERIIEEIAVKIKHGNDNSDSILCLIGPPGVGKTSIAQSVAAALNREFIRISLGGVQNESEIRGHRRTYIGSRPGRIISNLMRCKSNNPVFLLDEVDKMTHNSVQGDPSAALLEVLDPMVNQTFRDNYLEVDYDLSSIFFIATANDINAIPRVLLDRMEVINLGGYTENEKIKIAKEYIIPKQIIKTGMSQHNIVFDDSALRVIVNEYTGEAGVRMLEQKIVKILRHLAVEDLKNNLKVNQESKSKEKIKVTKTDIYNILGNERYVPLVEIKEDSVAMINGLAWTQNGGEIIIIEADFIPGKGEIILTGQLGDVMKESAKIAHSYVLSKLIREGVGVSKYAKCDLHINLPEGAIPKDGPSAGITLATVIYSLYKNQKIKASFAMTGEITLKGKVLPIGGLKEKTLAAIRHNIKNVIVPKSNEKDYLSLSDEIKKKINVYFVENIEEVYKLVLI